jgi:hypothetical protein
VVNGGEWFVKYAAQSSADLLNAYLHPVCGSVLKKSVLWNEMWLLLSLFLIFLFIF